MKQYTRYALPASAVVVTAALAWISWLVWRSMHGLGPLLEPPRDAVAQHPDLPLMFGPAVVAGALVVGIVYTLRTRSPLFFWSLVSGAVLYPFVVEPYGDWFVAVWYPTNQAIAANPFDRAIPWFAVMFYFAFIPLTTVGVWALLKRGLSAPRLVGFVALVSVLEVPMEMIGSHLSWMTYYGNHATVFGVPIYCIPQNGGMVLPVAVVLAWLLPRTYGWRWALVPFALAVVLPVFALITTWPAYLAIHLESGPVLGWTAGIIATLFNIAFVVACAYAPPVRRMREAVAHSASTSPVSVQADDALTPSSK